MTRRFILELQQDSGSQNESFSINPNGITSSFNTSAISDSNGYSGSNFPPYYKRQRPYGYRLKTKPIESISWQWLYATDLLVAYELTLTTRGTQPGPIPYSWLLIETVLAVGWLLKSYWNPHSPLFKAIELQSSSILTQGGDIYAINTMVPGSGQEQQQVQLSQLADQQNKQPTRQTASAFTHALYSCSGDGNGDSQKHSHTLGLDCFVHPCHGVCRFRTSSDRTHSMTVGIACPDPVGSLSDETPISGNLPASADDLIIVQGLLSLTKYKPHEETEISCTPVHFTSPMGTSATRQTTGSPQWGQSPARLSRTGTRQATDHSGNRTCYEILYGKNGQQRPCGKICKNTSALKVHKSRYHTGQRTCYTAVVPENGEKRPCGRVCNNAQALSEHKKRDHTGQQICDVTVVKKDGKQRPCGKVYKNAPTLSMHKSRYHTGQRTCQVTIVMEDGQQRSCAKVCKNLQALSDHKNRDHTGQQICDARVVEKDGQQRPCGKICQSARTLLDHKRNTHSGPQTCDLTVLGKDGPPRQCGKICKSSLALSNHKRRDHTGQQTCNETLVTEDGQTKLCGMVCKNAHDLSCHKRTHRKHNTVGGNQDVDLIAPKGRANR
ncbi:hypothetical protein [Endozoicomonas sp. 8E]|uniref:hypothetical protein n=1 Tax=Endozoicomonas sp. 8E TaxID=3035692 RepID=UPI0029393C0D|nr:hypothetical protein [Endozoicomonas sp. 8E]WOG27010.1 hypothetical protein P6910_21030 [Endozoicomonas sp. 8E]